MVAIAVSRSETSSGIGCASFFEVWVVAGLLCGYATGWIVYEHHFEEIESVVIEIRAKCLLFIALPFGE